MSYGPSELVQAPNDITHFGSAICSHTRCNIWSLTLRNGSDHPEQVRLTRREARQGSAEAIEVVAGPGH